MMKITCFALLCSIGSCLAETRTLPLQPAGKLQLRNVTAEPVKYKGREALRVMDAGAPDLGDGARLAVLAGAEFGDGTIEVDLAGDTKPGAAPEFRGFTGIAFRIAADGSAYESFYLRPKNGRAENQVQRNHSAQYISVPEFPWQRLRKEFPEMYESYVDLVPGEWTKVRIAVTGNKALLYVNGAEQPTLIVNELKHGVSKGGLALWIGPGTLAHFSNLRLTQ